MNNMQFSFKRDYIAIYMIIARVVRAAAGL